MAPVPFHLSIVVPDLAAAKAFYTGVLGCSAGRVKPSWLDIDFFGHQLTIHRASARKPALAIDHFGVILAAADWENLAAVCRDHDVPFDLAPRVDAPADGPATKKFVVRDPAGNRLEFKAT